MRRFTWEDEEKTAKKKKALSTQCNKLRIALV